MAKGASKKPRQAKASTEANLGFEAKLRVAATPGFIRSCND
jgi:hypothetical protein